MIIIKKQSDIEHLYSHNTLHKAINDYLQNFFHSIYKTFSDGKDLDNFSLDSSGYIVVLQTAGDVALLPEVGLTRGLTASIPEYVDKVTLTECGQYFELYHALFLPTTNGG